MKIVTIIGIVILITASFFLFSDKKEVNKDNMPKRSTASSPKEEEKETDNKSENESEIDIKSGTVDKETSEILLKFKKSKNNFLRKKV